MLDYLNFEADGVELPGNEGVSQEEHNKAKRRVWETVRRAIDAGYPTVAWEVMTLEMSKTRPNPALYSSDCRVRRRGGDLLGAARRLRGVSYPVGQFWAHRVALDFQTSDRIPRSSGASQSYRACH